MTKIGDWKFLQLYLELYEHACTNRRYHCMLSQFTPRCNADLQCLVISGCAATCQRLTEQVSAFNWHVTTLQSGVEALAEYSRTRFAGFDVIFMSLELPVIGDAWTTRLLVLSGCAVPIFLLAADPESVDAVGLGAMGAVSVPLRVHNLVALFLRAHRTSVERNSQIERPNLQERSVVGLERDLQS